MSCDALFHSEGGWVEAVAFLETLFSFYQYCRSTEHCSTIQVIICMEEEEELALKSLF